MLKILLFWVFLYKWHVNVNVPIIHSIVRTHLVSFKVSYLYNEQMRLLLTSPLTDPSGAHPASTLSKGPNSFVLTYKFYET